MAVIHSIGHPPKDFYHNTPYNIKVVDNNGDNNGRLRIEITDSRGTQIGKCHYAWGGAYYIYDRRARALLYPQGN